MRYARILFYALLILLPLGTRNIYRIGEIAGVPSEPATVSLFGTQLLVLFFAAAAVIAGWRRRRWLGAFPGAAVLFALFAFVSSLWAWDPQTGAISAGYLALGALALIGIAILRPDPHTSAAWLSAGAVLQSMLGLWQSFTQRVTASTLLGVAEHAPGDQGAFVVETVAGRWIRAYGTFPHPNVYGLYVAIGIICVVCLYMRTTDAHRRTILVAGLAVLSAGLTVAFSRSAWVALAVGLIIVAVMARGDGAAVRRRFVASVLCVIMGAIALGAVHADATMTRIAGKGRLEAISMSERTSQLRDAAMLFADRPILGAGMGQMPLALWLTHPDDRSPYAYQFVHDIYILAAVELGVIGLLAFLSVIALWVRALRKRGLHTVEPAFLAGAAAILAAGLVDHFPWSLWQGQLMMWILWGLSAYSGAGKDA